MKQKLSLVVIIFVIVVMVSCKTETRRNDVLTGDTNGSSTNNLIDTLFSIFTDDSQTFTNGTSRIPELLGLISHTLHYGGHPFYIDTTDLSSDNSPSYFGVSYSYNTYGKYLFIDEKIYYGGVDSNENTSTFIFDTDLKIFIPNRDIFFNTSDAEFHSLIIEYLEKDEYFERIDQDALKRYINDCSFTLFYDRNGLGIGIERGMVASRDLSWEIVLPYYRIQNFLTMVGRDIFVYRDEK